MQLTSINISICGYGINEGKYTGACSFKGQYGAMEVTLSPSMSAKVLAICAEALVDNAKDVAQNMCAEVIDQTRMLENKEANSLTANEE